MERFKYHSFVELGTTEVKIFLEFLSLNLVKMMREESYSKLHGGTSVFKVTVSSYEK